MAKETRSSYIKRNREMLEAYKEMNIGLVLGQASELVEVDTDGDKAIELLKEWSERDLPEKWTYIL
ncbi:hypothetical protein [Mesobacillus subterraneus]|nr:hypothetical protein [Mesobacillus subterraneus]